MAEQKVSSWEEKLDKKMKKLEKKVEEIRKTLEEKGEGLGEKVSDKVKAVDQKIGSRAHSGHSLFWGIVMIVVGFVWLGNNLGWFSYEIPWVPVVMIAVGIYLILRYLEKSKIETGNSNSKEKE